MNSPKTREQQAAAGEILRVISSSPTNVQPVFDTIAESAIRLCDARWGAVFRYEIPHALLLEIYTEAGIGTEIVL